VFTLLIPAYAEEESTWGSLIRQGNAAFNVQNLDDALRLFEQSLQMAGDAPEFRALSNHNIGMTLQTRGEYGRAEAFYQRAVEYWIKSDPRPVELMATTYSNYGDLLTDKHEFVRAKDLYSKALTIWKESKVVNPSRIAFAKSKLASSYNLNGETVQAEALLKEAIALLRSLPKPDATDLATSLDCLAKVYTYQYRFQEAEPLFHESMALVESVFGIHDTIYAISLQNVATMHRMAGNYARAEPLLRKAAAIYQDKLGPQHPYLIMIWNEQGMIALAEKKYDMAASHMRDSYELSSKVFGPNHLRTTFAKGNLALAYLRAGKLRLAKQMYLEVLDAERNSPDVAREELARTLGNCGQLALMLQEKQEAERYLREAVSIWRNAAPSHGRELAATLQELARALKASHNPEARQVEKEAKAFLETQRH